MTVVVEQPVDEDGWKRYFELVDTMQKANRYSSAVRLMRIGYALLYAGGLLALANWIAKGHTWVYIASGVGSAFVVATEIVLLRIRYRLRR